MTKGRLKKKINILNESETETAKLAIASAGKGIRLVGYILIALLIFGTVAFSELSDIWFLVFFSLILFLQVFYLIRLNKRLKSSLLPRYYIQLILKANVIYVFSLGLVVVTFATGIKV